MQPSGTSAYARKCRRRDDEARAVILDEQRFKQTNDGDVDQVRRRQVVVRPPFRTASGFYRADFFY